MGTILRKVCSQAQLLLQCEKGNKLKFPSFEDRSRNAAADAKNQIWTGTHISLLFLLFFVPDHKVKAATKSKGNTMTDGEKWLRLRKS